MTADEDAICREYEAGASLATVSTHHPGISAQTVRAILVKHGIPIKKSGGRPKRGGDAITARAQHVREIAALIVAGVSDRHRILQIGNTPTKDRPAWGVTIQTVDNYLMAARALLRVQTDAELADLRALARARFEQLWRDAEDPKTKLAVLAERNKFEGLNAPTKAEHSGTLRVVSLYDLSDDELAAAINAARNTA